jgi:hypothetical protein
VREAPTRRRGTKRGKTKEKKKGKEKGHLSGYLSSTTMLLSCWKKDQK